MSDAPFLRPCPEDRRRRGVRGGCVCRSAGSLRTSWEPGSLGGLLGDYPASAASFLESRRLRADSCGSPRVKGGSPEGFEDPPPSVREEDFSKSDCSTLKPSTPEHQLNGPAGVVSAIVTEGD